MIEKIQVNIHPVRTANSLANKGWHCPREVSFQGRDPGHCMPSFSGFCPGSSSCWFQARQCHWALLGQSDFSNLFYPASGFLKLLFLKGTTLSLEMTNARGQHPGSSFFLGDFQSLFTGGHQRMAWLTPTERISGACWSLSTFYFHLGVAALEPPWI